MPCPALHLQSGLVLGTTSTTARRLGVYSVSTGRAYCRELKYRNGGCEHCPSQRTCIQQVAANMANTVLSSLYRSRKVVPLTAAATCKDSGGRGWNLPGRPPTLTAPTLSSDFSCDADRARGTNAPSTRVLFRSDCGPTFNQLNSFAV